MLDLETLSTDSNGVIISVSMVEFHIGTGEITREFEMGINREQQVMWDGKIDADTLKWWSEQSKDVIAEIDRLPKEDLEYVLNCIDDWVTESAYKPKDIRLWGNGAGFDNIILRNLYGRMGRKFPLPYWCDKDVRTAAFLGNVRGNSIPFVGVKHRGLDDCKHQIKLVVTGYQCSRSSQ